MGTKTLTFRTKGSANLWWAVPIDQHDVDVVVQIGRDPASDIPEAIRLAVPEQLPNGDTISRNHARVIRRKGKFWVEDLSPTNPTCVNGKMVLSFLEIAPPFKLQLGDFCLRVAEEDLTRGQLREAQQPLCANAVTLEKLRTRTLDKRLQRAWPDVREELRWSDTLNQVLAGVREANTPAAARSRVAEILALYLSARQVKIYIDTARGEIGEVLRKNGVKKPDDVVASLLSALSPARSGEDAPCVPALPNCCVYARPHLFKGGRKAVNLCVARFPSEAPPSVYAQGAGRLTGLALTLLETFGKAIDGVRESRNSAKEQNPLEPSERMAELCEKHHYWGEAPRFKKMLLEADRAARKDLIERQGELARILFVGEPGVGKSALARIMQAMSDHAKGPFVEVNCAAITESLAEALLFGSREGAGTATKEIKGYFETVDDGVLFLDEIGALSQDIQAKLLIVLQNGVYRRVGDAKDKRTNCHVIAATNADLEALIDEGRFREDLYDRICTCQICIPPLRERPEDIPLIIDRQLARLNNDKALIDKLETPTPKFLEPSLREALCAHAWPKNVRGVVENLSAAFRHADDLGIGFPELPEKLRGELKRTTTVHVQSGFALNTGDDLARNAKRLELEYYARLMRKFNGAVGKVAEQAGVSPMTFLERRKVNFPALVAELDESEVARLRELAGPHWDDLVKET